MLLNCGVGKDSWESLGLQEIQPVHSEGDQSWIFIGRTDAEAEILILWPPDVKNWLTGKDPDARKDWRWEEKGMTEDEMVGWHHWLNGHEFEQTLGDGEGQGGLACRSSWGHRESDMTEWLNNPGVWECEWSPRRWALCTLAHRLLVSQSDRWEVQGQSDAFSNLYSCTVFVFF